MLEITRFAKSGGPLTKRISLIDGSLKSDGSACIMSSGTAQRVKLASLAQFAALIEQLPSDQAIALGALRYDLPDQVKVVTKSKLKELNGTAQPHTIARTAEHILWRPDHPAFALLDFDVKGMPDAVKTRMKRLYGFWPALVTVLPQMRTAGRVMRASTSAGLFRSDTAEKLLGSDGRHLYVLVRAGCDAERFLKTLHERCWLAGFGWMMVGAGGQLLERSIIDRMVGAPERLVFEGAPVLDPPLSQDLASRAPLARDGAALDTVSACPPLTIVEQAKLRELRAKEAHRLAPESARARAAFVKSQAERLIERTGLSADAATKAIERQCRGVLLPDVVLPFDDDDLAGITVADVLADPERFEGATLADPLEGIEYGRCKALIMRRAEGTPWINSFAHGRTTYELKQDAAAVEAALNKAPQAEVAATFVRLALAADIDADDLEHLRDVTAKRAGVGKRAIDRKLKGAVQDHRRRRAEEERNRRAAERLDTRPAIDAPPSDAPWLPQMQVLNDVLKKSTEIEPPGRDIEGESARIKERTIPQLHLLATANTNPENPPQ
jgi:hypothetical protein